MGRLSLSGLILCALAAGIAASASAQSLDAPQGPFLKERSYAELASSRVEGSIAEYIQATRGWNRSEYRIQADKTRRVPVVFLVTYLSDPKAFVESGRVFEIHLDAESGRVVGENPLSEREIAKALSSTD